MSDKIKILKVDENAKLPIKKTKYASCYDLFSNVDCIIDPNSIFRIKTGIKLLMHESYSCEIRPRSGMTCSGLICILGTIDADYKDEIQVIIHNTSYETKQIEKYSRIAQLYFVKKPEISLVDEKGNPLKQENTERKSGFGSTGMK